MFCSISFDVKNASVARGSGLTRSLNIVTYDGISVCTNQVDGIELISIR